MGQLKGSWDVLCNEKGDSLLVFSCSNGTRDSNEAEVWTMMEALKVFKASLDGC